MEHTCKGLTDLPLRLLYPRERILAEVERLAAEINSDYQGRELVVVVVLTGALFFAADLIRRLSIPLEIDTVQLASYQGTRSTGTVSLLKDLSLPLNGRSVLVVEDIVDTGLSLQSLVKHLCSRGVSDLRICSLIDKQEQRQCRIVPDYAGLACSSGFLVGYGLDIDGRCRELPDIYEVMTETSNGGHDDRPV